MKRLFAVFSAIIFMNLIVVAQNNSWLKKLEKIKPLQSIEKDVEQILGKPTDRYSNIGEYEIKDGEVSVFYSRGKCKSNSASEFNINKGTVISFDFTPKRTIKFSSLKLDLTKYTKEKSSDVVGGWRYYNSEKGIYYEVWEDTLKYVEFSGKKDLSVLSCSEVFK